jgi:rhamnosyltransferase
LLASIIIRTYNESKHLEDLLIAINDQKLNGIEAEIIVVDSGSIDGTLEIIKKFDTRLIHIKKEEFTFGRSLNIGCDAARGEALVFISGHCIPKGDEWLSELIEPLKNKRSEYVYGRQIGDEYSKYSERQLLNKYFPDESKIPQEGFFCNNATSAILKSVWEKDKFDEELTGLEDMALAKKLVKKKLRIGYVASSVVYHLHDETWTQVKWRYERESYALRHIMPEVHVSFLDFLRYTGNAIFLDILQSMKDGVFLKYCIQIIQFRIMQYWGTFLGNKEHRKLSSSMKERYFYPR